MKIQVTITTEQQVTATIDIPDDARPYGTEQTGSYTEAVLALCDDESVVWETTYSETIWHPAEDTRSGLQRIRDAIREERGGDLPVEIQGYA